MSGSRDAFESLTSVGYIVAIRWQAATAKTRGAHSRPTRGRSTRNSHAFPSWRRAVARHPAHTEAQNADAARRTTAGEGAADDQEYLLMSSTIAGRTALSMKRMKMRLVLARARSPGTRTTVGQVSGPILAHLGAHTVSLDVSIEVPVAMWVRVHMKSRAYIAHFERRTLTTATLGDVQANDSRD